MAFLHELLVLFRYPPRFAPALLNGVLPLRGTVLLGLRAMFLLGVCSLVVVLLTLLLMVVRRSVSFGLNHVFRLVG